MLPGMLPSIISIQSANGVTGKVMLALRSGVLLVSQCSVSSIYRKKLSTQLGESLERNSHFQ